MSRAKTPEKKRVLTKAMRQNRRIPLFVIARTKRKVMRNPRIRNWRAKKLGIKAKMREYPSGNKN